LRFGFFFWAFDSGAVSSAAFTHLERKRDLESLGNGPAFASQTSGSGSREYRRM